MNIAQNNDSENGMNPENNDDKSHIEKLLRMLRDIYYFNPVNNNASVYLLPHISTF